MYVSTYLVRRFVCRDDRGRLELRVGRDRRPRKRPLENRSLPQDVLELPLASQGNLARETKGDART